MQSDFAAQVLDPVEPLGRGAADHAVDLVALVEQELGQVRAILAGYAGDQSRRVAGDMRAEATRCRSEARRRRCEPRRVA